MAHQTHNSYFDNWYQLNDDNHEDQNEIKNVFYQALTNKDIELIRKMLLRHPFLSKQRSRDLNRDYPLDGYRFTLRNGKLILYSTRGSCYQHLFKNKGSNRESNGSFDVELKNSTQNSSDSEDFPKPCDIYYPEGFKRFGTDDNTDDNTKEFIHEDIENKSPPDNVSFRIEQLEKEIEQINETLENLVSHSSKINKLKNQIYQIETKIHKIDEVVTHNDSLLNQTVTVLNQVVDVINGKQYV